MSHGVLCRRGIYFVFVVTFPSQPCCLLNKVIYACKFLFLSDTHIPGPFNALFLDFCSETKEFYLLTGSFSNLCPVLPDDFDFKRLWSLLKISDWKQEQNNRNMEMSS